jgi:hypothetical protein
VNGTHAYPFAARRGLRVSFRTSPSRTCARGRLARHDVQSTCGQQHAMVLDYVAGTQCHRNAEEADAEPGTVAFQAAQSRGGRAHSPDVGRTCAACPDTCATRQHGSTAAAPGVMRQPGYTRGRCQSRLRCACGRWRREARNCAASSCVIRYVWPPDCGRTRVAGRHPLLMARSTVSRWTPARRASSLTSRCGVDDAGDAGDASAADVSPVAMGGGGITRSRKSSGCQ